MKPFEELWDRFTDIPINNDGEIQETFEHFNIGTDREEIWHWFEEEYDVSVEELIYKEGKGN